MIIDKMDKETVKDILRNKEKKIACIHARMLSLYKEIGKEAVLSDVAREHGNMDGMPGGKGTHKDISDIILAYEQRLQQREEEVREIMWKLSEQEEMINRVWMCLYILDEPYYSLLHSIYVENQLYSTVERKSGKSHKTFEKYRKRGIEQLISLYNSDEKMADLVWKYHKGITDKQIGEKTYEYQEL